MKITLIAALVGLVFGGAAGWGLTHGYYKGVMAEKDDKQQQALTAAQTKAVAVAAFATTTSDLEVTRISTEYERKLSDAQNQHDLDLRSLRSGALRLRDTGATCGGQPAEGAAGPSSSVPAGATGAELSVPASEFLLGEADRADTTVQQLNACAAVVRSDREVLDKLNAGATGAAQ
jgi:hypothetical protein